MQSAKKTVQWPPSVYIVYKFSSTDAQGDRNTVTNLVNKMTRATVKQCVQAFVESNSLQDAAEAQRMVEDMLNIHTVNAQNCECLLADAVYGLIATNRPHFKGSLLRSPMQQTIVQIFASFAPSDRQAAKTLGVLYGKLVANRTLSSFQPPFERQGNLIKLMFVWGAAAHLRNAFASRDSIVVSPEISSLVDGLIGDPQDRVTPAGAVACNIADLWK